MPARPGIRVRLRSNSYFLRWSIVVSPGTTRIYNGDFLVLLKYYYINDMFVFVWCRARNVSAKFIGNRRWVYWPDRGGFVRFGAYQRPGTCRVSLLKTNNRIRIHTHTHTSLIYDLDDFFFEFFSSRVSFSLAVSFSSARETRLYLVEPLKGYIPDVLFIIVQAVILLMLLLLL